MTTFSKIVNAFSAKDIFAEAKKHFAEVLKQRI